MTEGYDKHTSCYGDGTTEPLERTWVYPVYPFRVGVRQSSEPPYETLGGTMYHSI